MRPPSEQAAWVNSRATDLFQRAWFYGQVKRLWAKLTGQSRELIFLANVQEQVKILSEHDLERQSIRLEDIQGTQGRMDDFDRDFYPLHRRARNRWVSVATGMMQGVTEMPPVEVVQIWDIYFVLDGHHRVSAARMLDYLFIDAEVILWQVSEDKAAVLDRLE